MSYRIANTGDCEALTILRMDMRKERDGQFCGDDLYANTMDFFKRNISSGNHVAFVCEHNGEIIATAGLSLFEMPPTSNLINGKVAKLMNMYTIPRFREKGVGKAMLCFVVNYAKEHSYFKIMLNSSPMGKSLYEGFGFTLINNEYEFFVK